MQIEKNKDFKPIAKQKKVKFTDMGDVKEIMAMDKLNISGFPIIKLSKTKYMIIETGEVKSYTLAENRAQDTDSLRKTFKKLRGVITTNFHGNKNELCFTITYREQMTDTIRLYHDFEKFFKKLKYKYVDVDYISVVEPMGNGRWHCHVLLRFNSLDKIYIPNEEIEALWGQGFTKVKAIKSNVDNLGAYLSAYLGDIELTKETHWQLKPNSKVKEVEIDGHKKKFIKGGRLHLYPSGMNIYRCSRGIKQPIITMMTYEEAKKIVGATTPNYSENINILNDELKIVNSITYEQYNLKRTKNTKQNLPSKQLKNS